MDKLIITLSFVIISFYSNCQDFLSTTIDSTEKRSDLSLFYSSGLFQDYVGVEFGSYGRNSRFSIIGGYNIPEIDFGGNTFLAGLTNTSLIHKQADNLPLNIALRLEGYGIFSSYDFASVSGNNVRFDLLGSVDFSHNFRFDDGNVNIIPFIGLGHFGRIDSGDYSSGDFLFRYGFQTKLSEMTISVTFEKNSLFGRVDANIGYVFGGKRTKVIPQENIMEVKDIPLQDATLATNELTENKPNLNELVRLESEIEILKSEHIKEIDNLNEIINELREQNERWESENQVLRDESLILLQKINALQETKEKAVVVSQEKKIYTIQFFRSKYSNKLFPNLTGIGKIISSQDGNLTSYQILVDDRSKLESVRRAGFKDAFIVR